MFHQHRTARRRNPATLAAIAVLSAAALQTMMQPLNAAGNAVTLPFAHIQPERGLAADRSAVPHKALAGVSLTETILVALSALAVGMAIGVATNSRPRKNPAAGI